LFHRHQVNLAVVVDGWGRTNRLNHTWELQKDFAKSITPALGDRNLFINGGSASYVQSAHSASDTSSGTFHSLEEFESHVDAVNVVTGRTSIDEGIKQARSLLTAAPPALAAFIIIIVYDGNPLPRYLRSVQQADAARGEGVEVFVVGIGGKYSKHVRVVL